MRIGPHILPPILFEMVVAVVLGPPVLKIVANFVKGLPQKQLYAQVGSSGPFRPLHIGQQFRTFYHGTGRNKALEIYDTKLWLVGQSTPRGIYLADKIEIARKCSGHDGGIVIVAVSPHLPLKSLRQGEYVHEIQDAKPYKNYYGIYELTPIAVIDSKGSRIR